MSLNRRSFAQVAAASLSVAGAGCSGVLSMGPDPEVVETEAEGGLKSLVGYVDIHITVLNEGSEGIVEVILDLLDENETVLETYRESGHMREDERRRVTITVDAPDGTEYYNAEAVSGE
jgi:hypothetical protein